MMRINGRQFGHPLGQSTRTHDPISNRLFDILFTRVYNDTHIDDGGRLIQKTEVEGSLRIEAMRIEISLFNSI